MKLSIFLAGIRSQNWLELYNSIPNATSLPKEEYELVIVSPYELPPELQGMSNVRLIKDRGNPTRCYQLGALHSQGDYVVWGADDGTFCPTMAIDKAFDALPSHKGVVTFQYQEGPECLATERTKDPEWWHLRTSKFMRKLPFLPLESLLVMNALIERSYFMEIGGWDCRFEQLGMAGPDLSARLYNDGAEVVIGQQFMILTHERGTRLHKPIENAHVQNDKPMLIKMYKNKASKGRARIDFDNWKQVPEVWTRRFKG